MRRNIPEGNHALWNAPPTCRGEAVVGVVVIEVPQARILRSRKRTAGKAGDGHHEASLPTAVFLDPSALEDNTVDVIARGMLGR
jgi:hypothetical protein